MKFVVVNVRDLRGLDESKVRYCGRGWKDGKGVWRKSVLGNPFKVRDFGGSAGRTIPHYRRWLWDKIQCGDVEVMSELNEIMNEMKSGKTVYLGCHCKNPDTCHCTQIGRAAEYLLKESE